MADDMPTIIQFSEDISTAEAPPPLPVGEYVAQIRQAVPKLSQKSTKYAEVLFYINSDQYPVDFIGGEPDGTVIAYRRVGLEDTVKNRYSLRRFCEAIGAVMSKEINLNDWQGLEAKVKVEHEEYDGVARAIITQVRAAN